MPSQTDLLGMHEGAILKHTIKQSDGGTLYVLLSVQIKKVVFAVPVYITEKSKGIARAQLKACGFSVDRHPLSVLEKQPTFLAGHTAPVEIYEEEYGGKLRTKARIVTSKVSGVAANEIDHAEILLRSAKKAGEPATADEDLEDELDKEDAAQAQPDDSGQQSVKWIDEEDEDVPF